MEGWVKCWYGLDSPHPNLASLPDGLRGSPGTVTVGEPHWDGQVVTKVRASKTRYLLQGEEYICHGSYDV